MGGGGEGVVEGQQTLDPSPGPQAPSSLTVTSTKDAPSALKHCEPRMAFLVAQPHSILGFIQVVFCRQEILLILGFTKTRVFPYS